MDSSQSQHFQFSIRSVLVIIAALSCIAADGLLGVIAIPVGAALIVRPLPLAFLVSVPAGVAVLWRVMVTNEAQAPDSDFDIVFSFACMFWAMVLTVLYASLFLFLGLGRYALEHLNDEPPSEE